MDNAIKGLIGKKLGVTQVFLPDGDVEAVTAIQAGPCTVVQVKTAGNDGYDAVQLGFGEAKKINKARLGQFKELGKFKHLREVRVEDAKGIEKGVKVDVSLFKAGDHIDVTSVSKGRGFAGVVKRHHFKGGPKTHGESDRVRAPGSIGPDRPNQVLKGMRMGGHMGDRQVTVQNLEVVQADPTRNLLLVKGAVAGGTNALVIIKKTIKGK
jgi:large subunit ribosomal protein L3